MAEVELALAASARPWVDSLHRFLADHGGARVRTMVLGPEDVVVESYDVLLIDDVCSFLTPRLVDRARRLGRQVIGVFDERDGADAKQRLLECGVDDVIESEASPEEFLSVVHGVLELAPFVPPVPSVQADTSERGRVVVVGAPPGGCGATEVALALARRPGTVLVDADDLAPSVAQRMGLPLTPNLRSAIDAVYHRPGELRSALLDGGDFDVVTGLGGSEAWAQLQPGEVDAVVEELAGEYSRVLVNVGSGLERPQVGEGRFGLGRGMIRLADLIVGVGRPDPVSLTRLVRWVEQASELAPHTPMALALNRVPRSMFRRGEVQSELSRVLPGLPVVLVPEDKRVEEASWAGAPVPKGPFTKAMARLAKELGL